MTEKNILEIEHLSLTAVDAAGREQQILKDISIEISENKITCLVGESGSGKSMTIAAVLGILPKTVLLDQSSLIQFAGKRIFSVFQDPMNTFNPSVKVGRQLYAMARAHGKTDRQAFDRDLREVLKDLNFTEPERVLEQYPFELSGGMLQRLMLGCGIALKPELMICDEPTTALDVTVQKEILKILRAINRRFQTAILLVTHDFGVVAETADAVIVMEKGRVVEQGEVFEIFDHPREAYTKALMAAAFKGGIS